MNGFAVFTCAFALLLGSAAAGIDGPLAQCLERYGDILKTSSEERLEIPALTHRFSKDGIDVLATAADGKVVALQFVSSDAELLSMTVQLTPGQISSLLLRHAESWNFPAKLPPFTSWKSGDGRLFAQYDGTTGMLTICKKEFRETFTNPDAGQADES
jgi:hypothetical protein